MSTRISAKLFAILAELGILNTSQWYYQYDKSWREVGIALREYYDKYNMDRHPERELINKNNKELS